MQTLFSPDLINSVIRGLLFAADTAALSAQGHAFTNETFLILMPYLALLPPSNKLAPLFYPH